MRTLYLFLLCIFVCFQAVGFAGEVGSNAPKDGREVMVRVDQRPNGENRRSVLTMTLVDSRGRKRVRVMRSCSRDIGPDKETLMVFREPGDVRGTAFLSHDYDAIEKDDDKWLWMPALRRIRRISGSAKNEKFMGSDFSYDDMGDRGVEEDTHTLEGEETVDGKSCWVVLSHPKEEDPAYQKVRYFVRKDADLVIRADYYDRDGLLKTFRVVEAVLQNDFWTVIRSEMTDVVRNHKTILQNQEIAYDTPMDVGIFSVAKLRKARP